MSQAGGAIRVACFVKRKSFVSIQYAAKIIAFLNVHSIGELNYLALMPVI